jgi:hypothetical protein
MFKSTPKNTTRKKRKKKKRRERREGKGERRFSRIWGLVPLQSQYGIYICPHL